MYTDPGVCLQGLALVKAHDTVHSPRGFGPSRVRTAHFSKVQPTDDADLHANMPEEWAHLPNDGRAKAQTFMAQHECGAECELLGIAGCYPLILLN